MLRDTELTYEQWAAPENRTMRWSEIDDGVAVQTHHSRRQSILTARIGWALTPCQRVGFKVQELSSSSWVLRESPLLVRQPSVTVFPVGSDAELEDWYSDAPLLVAEVVTPGTDDHRRALGRKIAEYGEAGLRHYLVVEVKPVAIAYYRLGNTGALELIRPMSAEPLALPAPFNTEIDPAQLLT